MFLTVAVLLFMVLYQGLVEELISEVTCNNIIFISRFIVNAYLIN